MVELTSIKATGANRVVKPDKDGYYYVTLGAYNCNNSRGDTYIADGVKEHIADVNSPVGKLLVRSRLRGEAEHPIREPGMTDSEFIIRNLEIRTDRVGFHVRSIDVLETNHSEGIPGVGNVVAIKGYVKPSGVFGDGLKQSLDNPSEDTCFSVRMFTDDTLRPDGTNIKRLRNIINWDWVNSGGIQYAGTMNTLAVESESICACSVEDLKNASISTLVATEDEDIVNDVIASLGSVVPDCDIVDMW